jgi:hypothetical protein
MKASLFLAAALTAASFSVRADAAQTRATSFTGNGQPPSAGMVWRCGKNNPVAWWGTFGNGCLKQRRQAKNN